MFFGRTSADKKNKHNKTVNITMKRHLATAICVVLLVGNVFSGFIPVTETLASEVEQPHTTDATIEDTLYDSLDNSVDETSTAASEVLEEKMKLENQMIILFQNLWDRKPKVERMNSL